MDDGLTTKPISTSTRLLAVVWLLVIATAVLYIISWLNVLHTIFSLIATLIAGHLCEAM